MPVWIWSKVPNLNQAVDPNINWTEGQQPQTYNDSARQMLAQIAGWRDDMSGFGLTTGTGSAYVLGTNQGLPTPPLGGQLLRFTVHATSAASPTLQTDGAINNLLIAPGQPVPAGFLVAGCPYQATFYTGVGWIIGDIPNYAANAALNAILPPVGSIVPFAGATSPNANWAPPVGQQVSQTTYATLFTLVGTAYTPPSGPAPGSGLFYLPDLRGRARFHLDNMGPLGAASRITTINTDGGQVVGSQLGSGGGSQTHAQTVAEMALHSHNVTTAFSGSGSGSSSPSGTGNTTTLNHSHFISNATGVGGPPFPGLFAGNSGVPSFYATSDAANQGEGVSVNLTITSLPITVSGNTDNNGSSNVMSLLPPLLVTGGLMRIL